MITRRAGLTYLGGNRFGVWLARSVFPSRVTHGPRFAEVNLRGRSVGICW